MKSFHNATDYIIIFLLNKGFSEFRRATDYEVIFIKNIKSWV